MHRSWIRCYAREDQRHHGKPLWEWLLEQGNRLGVQGGSAFKAMAGFARHHTLHEARDFELAGSLTAQVQCMATAEDAQHPLDLLHREQLALLYAHTPASFGRVEPQQAATPRLDAPR